MRFFKTTFFSLVLLLTAVFAQANNGELILFYQAGDSPVTKDFVEKYADQIKEMATGQDIAVKLVDVTQGAPELIDATPAIVFQNHLGRSLYIGRYHYVDKIKTFIRTVKRMPQKAALNKKHDVMVWENEKSTVVSPVKITDLDGVLPKEFDQAAFKKEALAAIDEGMKAYSYAEHFSAERTHRLMYTAFYPYRAKDGKFFVSTEVYSQFNCVDPVFMQFDEPVSGSWRKWESAFKEAGKLLAEKISAELNNTKRGDGLLALSASTPVKSWNELGLPLPPVPEGNSRQFEAVDLEIAQVWKVDGPIDSDVPVINFNFLAPLDYYAGEITALDGKLTLGPEADLSKAVAVFSTSMKNLTMGDESLDEHVMDMIALADYPSAKFTFRSIDVVDQGNIAFGAMSQFVVNGVMDFKGIQAPLKVTAQIEPILDEAGKPRLQVYASFKLKQFDDYGIDGPDGSKDESNTMDFNLNFLMKPAK